MFFDLGHLRERRNACAGGRIKYVRAYMRGKMVVINLQFSPSTMKSLFCLLLVALAAARAHCHRAPCRTDVAQTTRTETHESKDVALTLLEKYANKAAKKAKEGVPRAKTFIRRRLDQLSQLQYALFLL
jgi:hypothetical protein